MANLYYTKANENKQKSTQKNSMEYPTLEGIAIRNVVQEAWKGKIKNDKQLVDVLDNHTTNMRKLLGNMEYETFCILNLLSHIKNMSTSELVYYLKMIEGITYFYKSKLGGELTSALLTGITYKAKDLDSLNRYYRIAMDELEGRVRYLEAKSRTQSRDIDLLTMDLRYQESSIFRFFMKGRINRIKGRITKKREKAVDINRAIVKNKAIIEKITRVARGDSLPAEIKPFPSGVRIQSP